MIAQMIGHVDGTLLVDRVVMEQGQIKRSLGVTNALNAKESGKVRILGESMAKSARNATFM